VATARAADDGPLAITGEVAHPQSLTRAALDALPMVQVTVTDRTGRATYRGPLLRTLLDRAALVDQPGGRTFLRHTVLVRGRDGYAVALAVAEIDPRFEGKAAIVACARDGAPLDAPRLVVPGDLKAGRSVRDVVAIEVR
jgi:hypothetical protein